MGLQKYNQKRDFKATPEPKGRKAKSKTGDYFCIQKHDATRLHYDFRLELDGVLLSWAVTKGPSFDPADKRLAVRTEDHPLDYGTFEGIIPEGHYGGGTVMLWDQGHWQPIEDPRKGLKSGKLKFELSGERMKGLWTLVRMHGKPGEKRENWLLIKDKDDAVKKRQPGFMNDNVKSIKTGRTMKQIAKGKSAIWGSSPSSKLSDGDTNKLQKKYKHVQLATLVESAPEGDDWVHEVKFDGYRLLGYISHGAVTLMTRNGNVWTDKFPHIRDGLAALDVEDAVVDMEAVVIDGNGKTNFQRLQNVISEEIDPVPIHAYLFDLLHLNGKDLRKLPLIERKKALKKIISGKYLHYSDHHSSDGTEMITNACQLGLEGIISKRADASYSGTRNRDWLKVKCIKRQEFVILGYTDSTAGSGLIGALHLGYYKGKKLHYAGKVGTGFTNASSRSTYKILSNLPKHSVPDIVPRDAMRGSHWIEPDQLAEVSFAMWTDEGRIRHASFHALRSDKSAKDVTIEKPKPAPKAKTKSKTKSNDVLGVTISHPERIVFEPLGVTKLELAEYYALAAPAILKDIKNHPISLLRCPEGVSHECFFQRNPAAGMGDHIKPFPWTHKGKKHTYFYADDAEGIVEMIQMGAIELHTWGATIKNIDCPDRIIFDCDPDPSVPFEAVKLAAFDLRQRLKNIGLESFVKCTGGKGLHVRVPIAPVTPWEDVKAFARSLCEEMELDTPEAYVTKMTKSKRRGKIFLDFFRNDYTATAVADWAVRARDGAPVAVPIEWNELKELKAPNQFSIKDAVKRLKKKMNDDRYTLKQRLTKAIMKSI